jgi:hypothetical protein
MSNILFIPQPLPEESPTSMLKRMAIKHGCVCNSDYQHLFGDAWYHSIPLSQSHPVIQHIARQAGVAGADFLSGFYKRIGILEQSPPLSIAGITVEADMIRRRTVAYCSECWREGHEHFIKDFKLACYCPYHNREYLTQCPNCRRGLHWSVPLVEKCGCDYLLISPTCSWDEAENERNLLSIFRAGATEEFQHLMSVLRKLEYPLGRDTKCPTDRCLQSIAFCIMKDNMLGLMTHLRVLEFYYPEIPKRILAAKLARFNDVKVRACVYEFLKSKTAQTPEHIAQNLQSVGDFYLTRAQIMVWLKIKENQWSTAVDAIQIVDTRLRHTRYSWKEAQTIAAKMLSIKLKNGFKKTKKTIDGLFKKDFQKKFILHKGVVKSLIDENFLTKKWDMHKIYFDSHDVEKFSENLISIQLLSAQNQISEKDIRMAISQVQPPSLGFSNPYLNAQLLNIQSSESIIEWCKRNVQPGRVSPKCPRHSLRRYVPKEGEVWLPTALAARYLGFKFQTIRFLVNQGILKNVRRQGLGGGSHIKRTVLDEFNKQYVGVTEAGKILGCGRTKASTTLRSMGIESITTPEPNKYSAAFYPRDKVLACATATRRIIRERKIAYTVAETCRKLKVTESVVFCLIKTGLLNFADSAHQCYGLINRSDVDTFNKRFANTTTVARWLNVSITCVFRILNQLSIMPVSGPPVDTSCQRYYAISDIKKYFNISLRKKRSNQNQKVCLVKASDLSKKYDISPKTFGRLFLHSGFTTPIKIRYIIYLIQSDVKKIERILNKYCTYTQGDRYLDERKCTRHLLKTKKIKAYYPLKGYCDYVMIKKSELHEYTTDHIPL